ncbi:phosphatidylinositol mannoside acyltransferase [Georgenia sp. MJ206]|uniref:phosphatidylinositol mannoside acyltransferase n=1 Tax=Georgenia wangjunii TaxID=3117730 RepID=UPI002F26CA97
MIDGGALLVRATRIVPRLPAPVSAGLFRTVADLAWALRIGGVSQLEANLARVRPGTGRRTLRRLTRTGMRSYMRYYEEALRLPSVSAEQLAQRVRATGDGPLREQLATGGSVVLALGHNGNWDLAGAWAEKHLGHVVTVAEHLQPEELFQSFLTFREGLGMTIIPLEKDWNTFRDLLRHARSGPRIIPLLADRDLSRSGVEVEAFGTPMRVAAGPASLALTAHAPLHVAMIRHERLRGARAQAAGSRWGIVIDFSAEISVPAGAAKADAVRAMSQAWVDVLAAGIAEHPTDWHMLQKVFVADLDPERLARSQQEAP